MPHIFLILLENNKYYVGVSNIATTPITNDDLFKEYKKQMKSQVDSALMSSPTQWTRIYAPIKVVDKAFVSTMDLLDSEKDIVNQYVYYYMIRYGIENVRGGMYNNIQLDANIVDIIKIEISKLNGGCSLCGLKGHYSQECSVSMEDKNNLAFYREKLYKKHAKLHSPEEHSKSKDKKIHKNIDKFEDKIKMLEEKYRVNM